MNAQKTTTLTPLPPGGIAGAAREVKIAETRVRRLERKFRVILERQRKEHADAIAVLRAAQERLAAASAATLDPVDLDVAAILKGGRR